MSCLKQNFIVRWIDPNRTLIFWLPTSSDITPLDFYLWELSKQKVYSDDMQQREHLCIKIYQACLEIRQK